MRHEKGGTVEGLLVFLRPAGRHTDEAARGESEICSLDREPEREREVGGEGACVRQRPHEEMGGERERQIEKEG